MIERKILENKFTQHTITNFIKDECPNVTIKDVIFEKNPLGERVTIYTSTPGLVIGREGSSIKRLTALLKQRFGFENPQIKIGEVGNPFLSASIVAKIIANDLENFGSQKFKLSGFKALTKIMDSGAMGCEIRLSGKLPSSRAKSWRFSKGYLKKTGYISDFVIDKAIEKVTLKTGVVGIKVQIMLPDTPLPDKIVYIDPSAKAAEAKTEADKKELEELGVESPNPKSESESDNANREVKEE